MSQDDWQATLVVAHGGMNNALLAYVTGVTSGAITEH